MARSYPGRPVRPDGGGYAGEVKPSGNTFGARSSLTAGDETYEVFRLPYLERAGFDVSRLPYSLRILLENLLRTEDGVSVTADDVAALARWDPKAIPLQEIAFTPARVLLQDFTGVPAIVDLAAMRDAMAELGGDPSHINPLQPVELVVDHSIQVDAFASRGRVRGQPPARLRAQQRALCAPALGPARVRELQRGPPEHRDRPPGEPRVPGPRGLRVAGDEGAGLARPCGAPTPTPWSAPTRTRRW